MRRAFLATLLIGCAISLGGCYNHGPHGWGDHRGHHGHGYGGVEGGGHF